jgi:hypothetical protein
MMPSRSTLVAILLLLCSSGAFAQEERAMTTTYSDALLFTPINLTVAFLPKSTVNPGVSASAEYTIRAGGENAIGIAGGFHPTPDGHESIGQLTWRTYSSDRSPVGSFWEAGIIGGASRLDATGEINPIIGVTARIGSIREARFSGVGFGYGLGPAVLLSNKKLHFKITMNFGLGMLLGKEVTFR